MYCEILIREKLRRRPEVLSSYFLLQLLSNVYGS